MKNKRKWIVVDCQNNMAWDDKNECSKTFKTYAEASRYAHDLAKGEPGGEVLICEAHTIVCADVKPVQTKSAK